MTITIRPFQTLDDYAAAEQLQAEVWGMTCHISVQKEHPF